MRLLFVLAVAGLTFAGAGCGEKNTVTGSGGKQLTVTGPAETTIKQGGEAKVTVKVTTKGFDENVPLTFSGLPEGVTVVDATPMIAKGAKEATFTLKADPTAPLKTGQKVQVTAKAAGMTDTVNFTLNVKEK
jgi:hypothetical protein